MHGWLVVVGLVSGGCGASSEEPPPPPPPGQIRFVDRTSDLGVAVTRRPVDGLLTLPDTFSGGVCLLDYDGDGDLDVFMPDRAGPDPDQTGGVRHDRLLRNDGVRFVEAGEAAGAAGVADSVACTVGDYDNDGDPDLVLAGLESVALLRNDGGELVDITDAAGLFARGLMQSPVFADFDGDRDLDLFLAVYSEYEIADNCVGHEGRIPCPAEPNIQTPLANLLFENVGGDRFVERAAASGLTHEDRTMVEVALDFDGDGDVDLLVGNDFGDVHPDRLYLNDGTGNFADEAPAFGLAEGGCTMGMDVGDVDGDGRLDVVQSNLEGLPNLLFVGGDDGTYEEASTQWELWPSIQWLTWTVLFADVEHDADLDLVSVGGHLYPDPIAAPSPSRQPTQLFRNDGPSFFVDFEVEDTGPLGRPRVGRGAAFGDLDGDLDLDLVIVDLDGALSIFENAGARREGAVVVELVGTRSSRDAIGALVTLECGGRRQVRQRVAGAGYLSAQDPRLHFGLGGCGQADRITVRWPSGVEQSTGPVPGGELITLVEPMP